MCSHIFLSPSGTELDDWLLCNVLSFKARVYALRTVKSPVFSMLHARKSSDGLEGSFIFEMALASGRQKV
jgi:hypothetical protein